MIGQARLLLTIPVLFVAAMLAGRAGAERAVGDGFAAMRVDRVDPPRAMSNVVLRGTDGAPIRLADFKGKVVLVDFLMAN